MNEVTRKLLELGVVGGVIVLPVITVLHTMLGKGGDGLGDPTALTPEAAQVAPLVATDPLPSTGQRNKAIGVLYSQGPVAVEKITIDKGYVYQGGENIETDSTSTGLLQLGKSGAMLICPNTRINVIKSGDTYQVNVASGQIRYVFPKQTSFEVNVRDKTVLKPAIDNTDGGKRPEYYSADVSDYNKDDCVICNLKGRIAADNILVKNEDKQVHINVAEVYRFGSPSKERDRTAQDDSRWRLIDDYPIPEENYTQLTANLTGNALLASSTSFCKCQQVYDEAYGLHAEPVLVAAPTAQPPKEITPAAGQPVAVQPVQEVAPVVAAAPEPATVEPAPAPDVIATPVAAPVAPVASVPETPPDEATLAAFDAPSIPEPWQPPDYFNARPTASPN